MRTLVCFGHRESEEVEVSTSDIMRGHLIVSRESLPSVFYDEDKGREKRSHCLPMEDIRLFHAKHRMDIWDDLDVDVDDDDDYEELRFDNELSIASKDHDEGPLFRDNSFVTSQRKSSRTASDDVLAVIDNMERALEKELATSQNSSSDSLMKSTISRFLCQKSAVDNEEIINFQPEQTLEQVLFQEPYTRETRLPRSGSAWNRLFPIERLRKKKRTTNRSDTLLLIPTNFKDSACYLAEDVGDAKTKPKAAAVRSTRTHSSKRNQLLDMVSCRTTKKCTTGSFLHRLLPSGRRFIGKKAPTNATVDKLDDDLDQDRTRSMSFELDGDLSAEKVEPECQPHPTFRNDDELIDHLIKVSDQNASLEIEEGLNWLQERIRSRSSSRSTASKGTKASSESLHPIFSHSYLDPPSLITPSPDPSDDEDDGTAPPMVAGASFSSHRSASVEEIDVSTSRAFSVEEYDGPTGQNESIPSASSIEDFFSCVKDIEYPEASLEAILFEQELEKLSTEELTLLLDAELDKLMRDGLA